MKFRNKRENGTKKTIDKSLQTKDLSLKIKLKNPTCKEIKFLLKFQKKLDWIKKTLISF